MKYHFKIHKEGKGYWAQGIELPGCFTQAESRRALEENMREALNLIVSEPEGSSDIADLPDTSIRSTKTVVEVPLDPKVAFSFWVRLLRARHKMTQKQVASKLGFKSVNQYQRLESSKYNPTLQTLAAIKVVFPDMPVEQIVG